MRGSVVVALLLLVVPALAGCESTQSRSRRLAREGKQAFQEKGLRVARRNADVRVGDRAVLHDKNGAAVAIALRNTSRRGMLNVPISIDVRDARGTSVFKNDDPGLEPSLVSAGLLRPGETFVWVHDQVQASGTPANVKAVVGEPKGTPPAKLPSIEVKRPKLETDPVSGVEATGSVLNRSKLEQRKLVLYGVARRAGRVVAAGRAQIPRLKAGRSRIYHIFFIGNPKGARLTVTAPPTTLK